MIGLVGSMTDSEVSFTYLYGLINGLEGLKPDLCGSITHL